MSVYVRTAAGTAAALNPLAKLPRNVRQLLIAIDGSTTSHTLAARMASEGDVGRLLELLQRAGLITETGQGAAQPGDAMANGRSAAMPPAGMAGRPAPVTLTDLATPPAPARQTPVAVSAVAPSVQASALDDDFSDTAPAAVRPAGDGHYELANMISLMSDFVTEHFPERALEIVLELESMGSIRELMAGLAGYHALVSSRGDAAHHHLAELQRLLDAV